MTALLQMRDIALRYGPVQALGGVDLEVAAGEVHALLGENGAGKSSLMQVLAGATRPQAGSMTLDGVPYEPSSTADALGRGVAMVFQELTLLPHLTVEENLWLGRERSLGPFVERAARRRDAERVLARLGHGDLAPDRRVAELSPATCQMVEIARAVLADARLLVLDEPTSSLGAADVERLFAVVRQLRDEGLGIVYISHALDEVRAVCDRCTVLRDGNQVATGVLGEMDDRLLVKHMAGRPLDELFPDRRVTFGAAVLAVRELDSDALAAPATFEVRAGEIAGIAGLAGAGRTELLEAVFGTRDRRGGAVELAGEPLVGSPAAMWGHGVGLLVEDRKQEGLATSLPIVTNVALPRLAAHCRNGMLQRPAMRRAVEAVGARVNLKCHSVQQAAGELSGGNQQKVAIGRLLHSGCRVLLLDEPTRGIDVGSRQEIYGLLDQAARDGAAILVVSSHLPELLGLCDRIAVMQKGRLGAFRNATDWTQEALLEAAMLSDGGDGVAASAGPSATGEVT